jgi:hypothetical protein
MEEEMDDLKSMWKQPGFKPKQEAEIASMLTGKSNTIVSKLKRSVWFELILTIVFGIGLGYYALTLENGAMRWTSISLVVLFIAYILYFVKKIMILNQFDSSTHDLKTTLQRLHERLTLYLTFYKRSYAILYPVYFCLGLLFGLLERGADHFVSRFSNVGFSVWFIVFTILFFVGIYMLTNWYLKKLYGNHLDKLRTLLNELEGN